MVVSTTSIFDLYNKEIESTNLYNIRIDKEPSKSKKRIGCSGTSESTIFEYIKGLYSKSHRWALDIFYPVVSFGIKYAPYIGTALSILNGLLTYYATNIGPFSKFMSIGSQIFGAYLGNTPMGRAGLLIVNFLVYIGIRTALHIIIEYTRPSDNDTNNIWSKMKYFFHYTIRVYTLLKDANYIIQSFYNVAPFVGILLNMTRTQPNNIDTYELLYGTSILSRREEGSNQLSIVNPEDLIPINPITKQKVRTVSWPEYMRYASDQYNFGFLDEFLGTLGLKENAYRTVLYYVLWGLSDSNSYLYECFSYLWILNITYTALRSLGFGLERMGVNRQIGRLYRRVQSYLKEGYKRIGKFSKKK